MERLTERLENGVINVKYASQHETAIHRLVTIEDILGDEYDLDRLRELAQADREGRCFVFRFGFGETVYRIWVYPSGKPAFVTENRMDTLNDLLNAETWNNAYKTRAEAEAALRREDTDARENR